MKYHLQLSILSFALIVFISSCKTKSELRREQEMERLQQEISASRGQKVDFEVVQEEIKTEMGRLGNAVEEVAEQHRHDHEESKKELATLTTRIQALEQRAVAEELSSKQAQVAQAEKPHSSYDAAKKLFDDGKYEDAADMLKGISKGQPKAQFLLAESYFAGKDYASSVLEYETFRKSFPKDTLVPNAIFRQAQAFKGMGKVKEAKLFFQDLIERFPKSPVSAKAKNEMKKLK